MIRKLKYFIPLVALVASLSCKKDFLDINTDPNNPTSIEVSKLLPTTQRTLGDALSMDENNGGLSNVLAAYVHQMTTREEADKYGMTGADPVIANPGPNYIHQPPTRVLPIRYTGFCKTWKTSSPMQQLLVIPAMQV